MAEADALRRAFDAYNRDDVDGVVAEAADHVEYVMGARGIRVTGRDRWREVVARIAEAFPGRRAEIVRMVGGNDVGLVEWVIRGTSSGAVEGFPPAGEQVAFEGCSVVGFADGRIAYWRDYVG
jgi:steroid delta-isomerase-like uncharacterized protein